MTARRKRLIGAVPTDVPVSLVVAGHGPPCCIADVTALRVVFGLGRDGELRRGGMPRRLTDVALIATWDPSLLAVGPRRLLVPLLPAWRPEPLKIHALLPGRRLVPAKVRMFLDLLELEADGTLAP